MRSIEEVCIKASQQEMTDENVELSLGDIVYPGTTKSQYQTAKQFQRCISLNHTGPVPFGTYGVSVGYNRDSREIYVCSETELPHGTRLLNKLETKRGFVEKLDSLYFFETS